MPPRASQPAKKNGQPSRHPLGRIKVARDVESKRIYSVGMKKARGRGWGVITNTVLGTGATCVQFSCYYHFDTCAQANFTLTGTLDENSRLLISISNTRDKQAEVCNCSVELLRTRWNWETEVVSGDVAIT